MVKILNARDPNQRAVKTAAIVTTNMALRSDPTLEPPTPTPTVDELAAKAKEEAKDIIAHPDVLELFGKSIAQTLAGEIKTAKLLFLCTASRLFSKPMNLALKGESAIGKSHQRDQVLAYLSPEDVTAFTTMTERALVYLPDDLAHEVLSMAEYAGSKERELLDYYMREIISAGRIVHYVPQRLRP